MEFVEVRTAQAEELRIAVREQPTLQERIVREVDAGHDVADVERDLLGLVEDVRVPNPRVSVPTRWTGTSSSPGHQGRPTLASVAPPAGPSELACGCEKRSDAATARSIVAS